MPKRVRRVSTSTRLSRFEFVDHTPDPISFSTLNYLKGSRPFKRGIGRTQPRANLPCIDKPSQLEKKPCDLRKPTLCGCTGGSSGCPKTNRARRKSGEACEGILLYIVGSAERTDIELMRRWSAEAECNGGILLLGDRFARALEGVRFHEGNLNYSGKSSSKSASTYAYLLRIKLSSCSYPMTWIV